MKKIPGWRYLAKQKAITADYTLKDFKSAISLIRKIALLAEKADHHPDLHLTRYRRLRIVLTTHDAGGVTKKDFGLARKIAGILSRHT